MLWCHTFTSVIHLKILLFFFCFFYIFKTSDENCNRTSAQQNVSDLWWVNNNVNAVNSYLVFISVTSYLFITAMRQEASMWALTTALQAQITKELSTTTVRKKTAALYTLKWGEVVHLITDGEYEPEPLWPGQILLRLNANSRSISPVVNDIQRWTQWFKQFPSFKYALQIFLQISDQQ